MNKVTLEDLAQLPKRIWDLEVKVANRTDILSALSGQHSDDFALTEQFIIGLAERIIGLEESLDKSYKELAEKFNVDLSEYASAVNSEMNKIQGSLDDFRMNSEKSVKMRAGLSEDPVNEGLGPIEITTEMMGEFIHNHIGRYDEEDIVLKRDLRYAFRKWLHQTKGRHDRDLSNAQAGRLYGEIESFIGPFYEETVDRFIGLTLVEWY